MNGRASASHIQLTSEICYEEKDHLDLPASVSANVAGTLAHA